MKTFCFLTVLLQSITIIILATLPAVFCSPAMAYTPPIGIPDPGIWGTTHPIDSSAPDTTTKCPTWPSGQTTNCYYIDNTNPQATDTNNTFGYPAKPRLTIPQTTYSAGAYVEIHGGPYQDTYINVKFNGTPENPIWFRGAPSSMPIITGKISLTDSTYAIFEYLDCDGMGNSIGSINISGMSAHHICVRNSKFHNKTWTKNTAAIGSTPLQGGSIHDLVFYNNDFSELGNWSSTIDQDFHGINPALWGRTPPTTQYNIWALNNGGYHISGNLVQFNGDQRDIAKATEEGRTTTNLNNFHHMYVGNNISHHCRQDLCVMKLTTDGIISQNTTYENNNQAAAGGTGIVFQEGPNYVWIIFNKLYSNQFGVRQGNMYYPSFQNQKTFIIGNVIYDIHGIGGAYTADGINSRYKTAQGIAFEKGNHQRYIVDNTIYNVGGGISVSTAVATDSAIMSGNVIAGVDGVDTLGRLDCHASKIDATGIVKIDYTYFQPRLDSGKVTFYWNGLSPLIRESLSDFQSASGQCQNCWTGDPLFVDAANYDLHPQADSPLIGKGIRHPVYDEFQTRYGINIAYDFDGKPRPDGAWTLGALEPGTLKATPLPPPPAPVPNIIK